MYHGVKPAFEGCRRLPWDNMWKCLAWCLACGKSSADTPCANSGHHSFFMVFGEPVCLSQQRSMPGDHHTPQCSLGQLASAWHRGLEQVLSWGSQSVPSSWMTLCKWQQHLKGRGGAPEGSYLPRLPSWAGPAAVSSSAWATTARSAAMELLS